METNSFNVSNENFNEAYSTDWLDTPLPSLSHVDSALRCQVCKDFYTTPMITSCSHTFCSLCIRRCLSNDGRCPACRTQEQELKLRNNGAMEELVEAFKIARGEVLEYALTSRPLPLPLPGHISTKRKLEDTRSEDDPDLPSQRTRSSKRLKDVAEKVVFSKSNSCQEDYMPEINLVRCPICNLQILENQINAHLDRNCQETISRTTQKCSDMTIQKSLNISRNAVSKPLNRPERLPKLNFSMLKDVQLRKRLAEYGLNQSGSRQAMEKRCTEWTTLWNANCDAARPRPARELRGELERWERIQDGKTYGTYYAANHSVKIREKGFDGKAWSDSHTESFRELTEKARSKFEKPHLKRVLPEMVTQSPEKNINLTNAALHPTTLDGDMKMSNSSLLQQSSQKQRKVFEECHLDNLSESNEIVPA